MSAEELDLAAVRKWADTEIIYDDPHGPGCTCGRGEMIRVPKRIPVDVRHRAVGTNNEEGN
jgi:hypothetical protein